MGRKTETYNVDTRSETNYRFEQQQKNLGPQLGGVIFSERLLLLAAAGAAGLGRPPFWGAAAGPEGPA